MTFQMNAATARKSDQLRPNSRDVLAILHESSVPLSAYQILERADSTKLRSPVQVYRALKVLTRLALVHRVETLNKYIACRRDHPMNAQPVLVICDDCGTVTELSESLSMEGLEELLAKDGFIRRIVNVEVAGLCLSCRDKMSL